MENANDALNSLYTGLCSAFKEKLESGEYTAQDLNVIRQFLKDNNVSSVAARGSPIANVIEAFPFQDEDDDNAMRHRKIQDFS